MIGNISEIEVKIDKDTYYIRKLYLNESYDLYMRSISILAPLFKVYEKTKEENGEMKYKFNKDKVDYDEITKSLIQKLDFDFALRLLLSVKKNGIELKKEQWNVSSPFLVFELLGHVIKFNIIDEFQKKRFRSDDIAPFWLRNLSRRIEKSSELDVRIMRVAEKYMLSKSQLLSTWYLSDLFDALEFTEINAKVEEEYYKNREKK